MVRLTNVVCTADCIGKALTANSAPACETVRGLHFCIFAFLLRVQ